MTPTKETAMQFCLMLQAGMPAGDAIRYFLSQEQLQLLGDKGVQQMVEAWLADPAVRAAQLALMGMPWQEMTAEEQIKFAINKHYVEMAYFLYANNYVELRGESKAKADTCRLALESKLAGTAGQSDPLSRFYEEVLRKKLIPERVAH